MVDSSKLEERDRELLRLLRKKGVLKAIGEARKITKTPKGNTSLNILEYTIGRGTYGPRKKKGRVGNWFLFDEDQEEQTVEVRIPLTDTKVFQCKTCGREYYINEKGCLDEYYLLFSVEDVISEGRRSKVITCQKCGQEIRVKFNSKG